ASRSGDAARTSAQKSASVDSSSGTTFLADTADTADCTSSAAAGCTPVGAKLGCSGRTEGEASNGRSAVARGDFAANGAAAVFSTRGADGGLLSARGADEAGGESAADGFRGPAGSL